MSHKAITLQLIAVLLWKQFIKNMYNDFWVLKVFQLKINANAISPQNADNFSIVYEGNTSVSAGDLHQPEYISFFFKPNSHRSTSSSIPHIILLLSEKSLEYFRTHHHHQYYNAINCVPFIMYRARVCMKCKSLAL